MKVLVITQYFWPENFKINDLCLGLQDQGHQVEVLTGLPNYPAGKIFEGYGFFKDNDEIWNGLRVHRSKLAPRGNGGMMLILNYLSFALFASVKGIALKKKYDRILVYQPSPVTVGIPALIINKIFGTPYYFWVQDLWPESLSAAGNIHNKMVLRIFDVVTRTIYKHAAKILVQSDGFRNYILNQNVPAQKLVFYPNTTEDFYQPVIAEPHYQSKLPNGFIIMFAGNFGESQAIHTILGAAKEIRDRGYTDIKFVFLGDGRMRPMMEQIITEHTLTESVFLLGSFPGTEMPNYFACADVLISSLKKDKIFALTIPSKIQSYLACGKPILASMDGEGAKIIDAAGAGLSSQAEDVQGLIDNILKMYAMPSEKCEEMGARARQYFLENFERGTLIRRLEEILDLD